MYYASKSIGYDNSTSSDYYSSNDNSVKVKYDKGSGCGKGCSSCINCKGI